MIDINKQGLINLDFHINIAHLDILDIRTSSGIFSGENTHAYWSAMSKSNTGLNLEKTGNSHGCINMVSDRDIIDMWSEPDIVIPPSQRPVSPK